ncbi:Triosephosphate isomerase [Candidatus Terasakiella magnetica]|uniref:Triosephosphate isomerase n=1 Tax=Candidatus Terasakiella magnetica TaxID=1867952 RepID=A0A1C3RCU3_9PROT|nr:triose-phosphate isomerase [Candidatus Terasakiella magnetica]SCA55054.1 Triosephosphate isomerase [Candidatus Terasakiella magnetica]
MTERRPLIAGNWKMNGLRADARRLAVEIGTLRQFKPDAAFDLLVCPPFTVLEAVSQMIENTGVYLGAQTCHVAEKGAHTGDISAAMVADSGCSHVILGHSERRTNHAETNDQVNAQAKAAHEQSLIAIICVGETEAERESGKALEVVAEQVKASVPDDSSYGNTVIAYEPVWAIGTGKVATPDDVQEVHANIRKVLAEKLGQEEADGIRILYGGSMKPENAKELLALGDVDGGLIGGASLKAEDFWAIAQSCPSI